MRDFARQVQLLVHKVTLDQLLAESMRRLALERALELLGEAARRVTQETRRKHPEIDWRRLVGQRAVLAHDYGEINHRRLYDTAREKIPLLVAELDRILGDDR
jgi:uncharacterized protein with HEPN domain